MNKIDKYLKEIYVREELNLPNLNLKSVAMKMNKALDEKDPKGSIKRLQKIIPPGIKPSMLKKIDSYISSHYDKYDNLKGNAQKIIKNSIDGVSNKMAEIAAIQLVIMSMVGKKSQVNMTHEAMLKLNIKDLVMKTRKFGADYEEDEEEKKERRLRPSDYADLSVAWVIIVMSSAVAVGIGGGIFVVLKAVAAVITASLGTLLTIGSVGILLIICIAVVLLILGRIGVMGGG